MGFFDKMIKPQIADRVHHDGQNYRVTGFLKRHEETCSDRPQDPIDEIVWEVVTSSLLKEKLERQEAGLSHNRRFRYQWCLRNEATHIHVVGVSAAILPIETESFGPVNWPSVEILKAISDYESSFMLGKFTDWVWE